MQNNGALGRRLMTCNSGPIHSEQTSARELEAFAAAGVAELLLFIFREHLCNNNALVGYLFRKQCTTPSSPIHHSLKSDASGFLRL